MLKNSSCISSEEVQFNFAYDPSGNCLGSRMLPGLINNLPLIFSAYSTCECPKQIMSAPPSLARYSNFIQELLISNKLPCVIKNLNPPYSNIISLGKSAVQSQLSFTTW